ncbi:hypothetical protein CKR_P38 (plasmid) [Clostridium kluyveri NBRC 12016]|uniref:Uncharacterized protein n=1 Tax=Clostridium kluyveri (strain NBRC 12016) TaxID=583346 RepID=B9E6I0_CLOK1|nr:hypothetical protein CKR_P38 [Clostridium kluyveri NBRC 12016]
MPVTSKIFLISSIVKLFIFFPLNICLNLIGLSPDILPSSLTDTSFSISHLAILGYTIPLHSLFINAPLLHASFNIRLTYSCDTLNSFPMVRRLQPFTLISNILILSSSLIILITTYPFNCSISLLNS